MMKYIPNRHIKRMFPYAFYDELYEILNEYTPENVVFLLRDTEHEKKLNKDKIKQFNEVRNQMLGSKEIEENNIFQLDQGEFLIIDNYIKKSDVTSYINKQPINRYVLLGQLFDKNEEPIFSKDGDLSIVRNIPEILWDDPNLALILMKVSSKDTSDELEEMVDLGIIKGPQHFINRFVTDSTVEPIEGGLQ